MTFKTLLLSASLLAVIPLGAQERLSLWPEGAMPNSRGMNLSDSIANERVYRVGEPCLFHYAPKKKKANGAAVVIVPGGGYLKLAYEVSGDDLAKWYADHGLHAFVLWHRLPNSPDLVQREIAPLQDAQRAMRLIRSRAAEWNLNPMKIGVMGSSAGGHLATTLGTHREDVSAISDALDSLDYGANFMVLVSPVVCLDDDPIVNKGSRNMLLGPNPTPRQLADYSNDLRVNENTPPAIMFHADNDRTVPAQNSLRFYAAMKQAGRPASLHVFPAGGHSISLEKQPGTTQYWSEICLNWLVEMGFIPDRSVR